MPWRRPDELVRIPPCRELLRARGLGYLIGDMRRRHPLVRRCTALVLMLHLGLFSSAEVSIADVHDGDATTFAAVTSSDRGTRDARPIAIGETAVETDDAGAPTPAPGPTHSIHVDHCAHAHVAPVASVAREAEPPREHALVRGVSQRSPASTTLAPPVPPPLA